MMNSECYRFFATKAAVDAQEYLQMAEEYPAHHAMLIATARERAEHSNWYAERADMMETEQAEQEAA